jgi:hypothetical protein
MSIFSGSDGRQAAMQAMLQAQQTQAAIDQLLKGAQATGTTALTEGRDSALGAITAAQPLSLAALGTGRNDALEQIDAGESLSLPALTEGRDYALGAIDSGEGRSLDALGQGAANAKSYFQPYATTGGAAFSQAADAAGVNGAEGHDRAVASFRTSPGYDKTVDMALDGVMRKASATGQLASGNTDAELLTRAHDLADQEYGTYYGRLNDLGRVGYDAAGRMSALDSGLGKDQAGLIDANSKARATVGQTYGTQGAGIYDANAKARAGIETGLGTSAAGVYGDTGRSEASIYGGTGSSLASLGASLAGSGANALSHEGDQLISATNAAYKAGDDADKNAWGLGMGLANIGGSVLGSWLGGQQVQPRIARLGR